MAKKVATRKAAPKPADVRAEKLDRAAQITPELSEKKLADIAQSADSSPKEKQVAQAAQFAKADDEGKAQLIEAANKRIAALGY